MAAKRTLRVERHMEKPSKERKNPRTAEPGEAVSGFPEPPGRDPGDISDDPTPHHSLGNPAGEPDPTEWPDPYESRPDPRGPPEGDEDPSGGQHPPTGSTSTSEPHPSQDPEADDRWEGPKRDKLDR
jgi:hypothetical protein